MHQHAHLFLIGSDFKLLVAELVRQQYPIVGRCHVLSYTQSIVDTIDRSAWDSVHRLYWASGSKLDKYLGMRARIHHYLDVVSELTRGADQVTLYLNSIHSESCNYMIRGVLDARPGVRLRVHLLMDGLLNLRPRPMGLFRRTPQLVNTLRWLWDRRIRYYVYRGDRLGTEDPIVERVYLVEGFPHRYPPQKVATFRLRRSGAGEGGEAGRARGGDGGDEGDAASAAGPRRLLVLGTPLERLLSEPAVRDVRDELVRLADGLAADEVHYKPHPLEKPESYCYCPPGATVVRQGGCVERLLASRRYDAVLGTVSSAMINLRLFLPRLPVYAGAIDRIARAARRGSSIHDFIRTGREHGVILLDTGARVPPLSDPPASA